MGVFHHFNQRTWLRHGCHPMGLKMGISSMGDLQDPKMEVPIPYIRPPSDVCWLTKAPVTSSL